MDVLNKLRKNTGNLIVITGVLHLILGPVEHQEAFGEILQSGIINTADRNSDTYGFFWFEMSGLFVVFTGLFIQYYISAFKKQIPKKFGWYLLVIALFGCLLEPVSGFYIFIPVSALIIYQREKCAVAMQRK